MMYFKMLHFMSRSFIRKIHKTRLEHLNEVSLWSKMKILQ